MKYFDQLCGNQCHLSSYRGVGELIFNCNFLPKILPHLSGLPLFYKDVLNAWQRIVVHTLLSKNEEDMRLFGTTNLLQLRESQYSIDRGQFEAGVKYLKTLMTEDGNLIFHHTFRIKTHFLQYLGLLNAISISWKKKLRNSYEENETKRGTWGFAVLRC